MNMVPLHFQGAAAPESFKMSTENRLEGSVSHGLHASSLSR
jgi:hypothetical protein